MPEVTFITCVNDFEKYNKCVRSSLKYEEEKGTVELVAIDNSFNNLSIAQCLKRGIEKGLGNILVCCHQDVIFPPNWIEMLLGEISVIEKTDNNWGVIGTFGVAKNGMFAGHVIDPSGHFHCLPLPAEVQSLDEHCLVIRKDSGLKFDEALDEFHFYGADICLQAMSEKMVNYAIDACVEHLSSGKIDEKFIGAVDKFCQKWENKKSPLTVIETTCKMCRLQGGLKGFIAYRIARHKRKQRRKKRDIMLKNGMEYTKLRHDSI